MEKIIINPEEVRGLGNVVSPKTTSSFILSDSELSSATESVNGVNLTTYHMTCSTLGILAVSVSPSSITVGGNFAITVSAVDRTSEPVSGLTVTISYGSSSYDVTTGSDGTYTLNVYSYTTATGNIAISASATGYNTATTSITVNKHTSSVLLSIASSTVTVGGTFILSGTLSIDNVGTSGETVKIYQDDEVIATVTTGSGGTFSRNVSATTAGTTKFQAVYEGSSTINSSQTPKYTCTVTKKSTSLNITVPALVYSDEFDVTGVLKDGSNNAISGASVKLYMEHNGTTTLEATQTTDSNGEVTYHRSAPTSITTYDFWLVYDGDSTYSDATSSTVEKTVGKETTVLSVSSPSNNASITVGDTLTVSGTIFTNDAEKLTSAIIYIKEGTTTLGSVGVDSSTGAFSTTISNLSVGTHNLSIEYGGSTYYLASSVSRTVVVQDVVSVSTVTLTSNKSVLSYADSESATLTATALTSQNVGVPGQEIMFYSGTPTIITNDCTSSTDFTTVNGSPTFAQTGMTIHEDSDRVYLDENVFDLLTGSYEVTITCTKPTGSSSWYGGGIVDSSGVMDYDTGVFVDETNVTFMNSTFTTPSGLGDTIEITLEITPSTQKIYINDYLVGTTTIDYTQEAGGIPVFDTYNYLGFWKLYGDFEVNNISITSGSSFVAYGTTDSNGVASVTYQSKDSVTESITATCNNISSTSVSIENCYFYDASSSSNLTKYTVPSNATMTYDNTENAYKLVNGSNGLKTVILNNITFANKIKLVSKFKLQDANKNKQLQLAGINGSTGLFTRIFHLGTGDCNFAYYTHGLTSDSPYGNLNLSTPSISSNTWYIIEVVINETSVTATLKSDNGTVIDTLTGTVSILSSSSTNQLGIAISNENEVTGFVKDIKIINL